MSMLRFGHAAVTMPFIGVEEWFGKTASNKEPGMVKVAKSVVSKYDPAQWLLSHVTIIASVDTDLADKKDQKSNYLIKPEYSQFVNNNGDAWERELLKGCYKTFLGADNYVEHVQLESLSKGKIIDVALRDVPIGKDDKGKEITTLYVDILIATDRKHVDLINQIESGEYNATSMGCKILFSICSRCGNVAKDDTEACQHVKYFKGNYFFDDNGVRRRIAELCGHKDQPNSVEFIDASWVKQPAFTGAVLRNIVKPEDSEIPQGKMLEQIEKALKAPSYVKKEKDLVRAASKNKRTLADVMGGIAEASKEGEKGLKTYLSNTFKDVLSEDDEEPAKDTEDKSTEEAPADTKDDAVEDTGFPEAPADGAAPADPNAPATDPSTTPIDKVKDEIKTTLLNKVKEELLDDQQKMKDRPVTPENYLNDNMVHSSKSLKFSNEIKSKFANNKKLLDGILILSNVQNWSEFKKYGYTRNDVLGLLHLFDTRKSSTPLSREAVKSLSRVKLGSDWSSFFTEYLVELGRKASTTEYKKVANWARILKNFD